ncbi:uncharacterized protein LOC108869310, partial [Brassica rapa]
KHNVQNPKTFSKGVLSVNKIYSLHQVCINSHRKQQQKPYKTANGYSLKLNSQDNLSVLKYLEMKELLKVILLLIVYLTCSKAMVPYRGCDLIGLAPGGGLGKYETTESKEKMYSGRKLVSGPSRSSCGH